MSSCESMSDSSAVDSDFARQALNSKKKGKQPARRAAIKKKPPFSKCEILKAMKMYRDVRPKLVTQKGGQSSGLKKKTIWAGIALEVSKIGPHTRSGPEVKAKVAQIRSKVKGAESDRLRELRLTGGGSPVSDTGRSVENEADDLDEAIRRAALHSIPKIQIVGFNNGIDLSEQKDDSGTRVIRGTARGLMEMAKCAPVEGKRPTLDGIFKRVKAIFKDFIN